jgi:hypothetical protein
MAPTDTEPLTTEIFEFIRKSEEAVLEVGRKWVDSVGEFVPVEVPLMREMSKQVFDFLDELLRIQREFAGRMLDETRRLATGEAQAAPKRAHAPRATKSARKAA